MSLPRRRAGLRVLPIRGGVGGRLRSERRRAVLPRGSTSVLGLSALATSNLLGFARRPLKERRRAVERLDGAGVLLARNGRGGLGRSSGGIIPETRRMMLGARRFRPTAALERLFARRLREPPRKLPSLVRGSFGPVMEPGGLLEPGGRTANGSRVDCGQSLRELGFRRVPQFPGMLRSARPLAARAALAGQFA